MSAVQVDFVEASFECMFTECLGEHVGSHISSLTVLEFDVCVDNCKSDSMVLGAKVSDGLDAGCVFAQLNTSLVVLPQCDWSGWSQFELGKYVQCPFNVLCALSSRNVLGFSCGLRDD